jgi:hypothetical protein
VDQVVRRASDEFGGGVAEQALDRRAEPTEAPVRLVDGDEVAGVFSDEAVAALALVQRAFADVNASVPYGSPPTLSRAPIYDSRLNVW